MPEPQNLGVALLGGNSDGSNSDHRHLRDSIRVVQRSDGQQGQEALDVAALGEVQ